MVSSKMRAPRIRARLVWRESPEINKKKHTSGCSICKNNCIDEQKHKQCDRLTRSGTKWLQDVSNSSIVLYETYRCMPLLGDEEIHAPGWEEHIVRYHIVYVTNKC